MKKFLFRFLVVFLLVFLLSACGAGDDGDDSGGGGGGNDDESQEFKKKVGQGHAPPGKIGIPGREIWDAWKDAFNSVHPGLIPETKDELEGKLRDWGYEKTNPGDPPGFDTWTLKLIIDAFAEGVEAGSRDAAKLLPLLVPGAFPFTLPVP